MNRHPALPASSFSRSRRPPQFGNQSILEGSQEYPTAALQEPLLSQPIIPTKSLADDKNPHGRFSRALERLETSWFIETLFLLCSAACAVLIVMFLAVHNNTGVEDWHYYFSINTVVSSLGVIFKLTLIMAVSTTLAQEKWTWFRKRSSALSTFEAIDAGSRGPYGSFKLLLRMRGQHLVSAGALVIALGFMVQPFLQAVISDYGLLVDVKSSGTNSVSATIGRSRRFDGGTQCISTYKNRYPKIDTTPDFAISASLYDGLNAAGSHGYRNVSFTCMLGNCTWSEYISIAIRSTCFDISGHLKRTTPDDPDQTTISTTEKASPTSLSAAASSTDTSESNPDTEMAMYPTEAITAFSDVSTVNSMVASIRSSVTRAAVTIPTDNSQDSAETEAPPGYAAPSLTALTAFGDVSTVNSVVAPIQSTAIQASEGLDKRASASGAQSSSTASSQSSATWSDWTLDHIDLTLSNTNEEWRNANTFAVLQAAVVADPNLTINFRVSQTLLAAFTVIRADNSHPLGSADWDAANASAMECGLELALNVYNSSVVNNMLTEQIIASVSKKVPGSWLPSPGIDQGGVHPNGLQADPGTLDSNPIYHDTFLYRDDYALDPAGLQSNDVGNFSVTQKTLLSTVDFLTSLIRQNNDNATVKAVAHGDQTALYTYGSPILQPLFNQTNTTATFDAIAKSMSNAIRNLGTEPITGTTRQWVRFYRVRWAFLALPLSLFTIGAIFFILSIADAHRAHVPNFKANSIATMIHGPDEPLQRHLRTHNHVYSLGVASDTVAKLEWYSEGWSLTAADQPTIKVPHPTTPIRDEEEHETYGLRVPTTPRTRGSDTTLVD